jgi:hypothetical protein
VDFKKPAEHYSRGSTGSLSSASTSNTHSCTRRNGSRPTNRSSPSIPSANSRRASDRLAESPAGGAALKTGHYPAGRAVLCNRFVLKMFPSRGGVAQLVEQGTFNP